MSVHPVWWWHHDVVEALAEGFQIEDPNVFVSWGADEPELQRLFPTGLRTIAVGYFTIDCVSLGGLRHTLGLHMTPREGGGLHEVEFFRPEWEAWPADLPEGEAIVRGFALWQEHLEAVFGPPTRTRDGDCGLPSCEWQLGPALVRHLCQYRFGPEEHVRISRY